MPWPPGANPPVAGARKAVGSLLNVLQAACDWQVQRVGLASTIGVYGGVSAQGALRADVPLPMMSGHVIPAFKKIGELLAGHLAGVTGIEVINYRLSPWGPGGNPNSPSTAVPQLVHTAARGTAPTSLRSALFPAPATGSTCVTSKMERQQALDLFDTFGTKVKTLHANLGGHAGVPAALVDHVRPTAHAVRQPRPPAKV